MISSQCSTQRIEASGSCWCIPSLALDLVSCASCLVYDPMNPGFISWKLVLQYRYHSNSTTTRGGRSQGGREGKGGEGREQRLVEKGSDWYVCTTNWGCVQGVDRLTFILSEVRKIKV